jgi:hypothetical protein
MISLIRYGNQSNVNERCKSQAPGEPEVEKRDMEEDRYRDGERWRDGEQ